MSAAALLSPPAQPPHDPKRLPLGDRGDWHAAYLVDTEIAARDGALVLGLSPRAAPGLLDADGTFGGLTTPVNVALGRDGSVWLLDRQDYTLKRFDFCECKFDTVPCFGGAGAGPRELAEPGGIGICGGNLFVADAGNARVQVFSLHGLVLRASWQLPSAASVSNTWRPRAVSFDASGRVLVADDANGCIHVFSPAGGWMRSIEGVGAVSAILTDCDGQVYALVPGTSSVMSFDIRTGKPSGSHDRVSAIAARFSAPPFPIDAQGNLGLGVLCVPPSRKCFDSRGTAVECADSSGDPSYHREGFYYSGALDSRRYRCAWDRLELAGRLPASTRIKVWAFTAETELSDDQIQALDPGQWTSHPVCTESALRNCRWDCLLRTEPGRFLWLRLQLCGDGFATPRLERIVLDYPRISLRRYLPAVVAPEPVSADFTDRFLAIFDRGQRQIEGWSDQLAQFFDPLSAPAEPQDRSRRGPDFLSWLASWIGIALDRRLPEPRRRAIVKSAGRLFARRGTLRGIREMLGLYLGLEPLARLCPDKGHCGPCTTPAPPAWQPPQLILEHFQLRRWLYLGAGRLGDQARLWGQRIVNRSQLSGPETSGNAQLGVSQLKTTQDPLRDPFHVYAHKFSVFVPACYGRSKFHERSLRNLLRAESPAHAAWSLVFVEPRFRIGVQSMIGFDAVVGCYPTGNVRLDESRLGLASVLGAARRGGPSMRLGQDGRIGTTSRLN